MDPPPGFCKSYRCVQRLDGFVSVDSPYEGGSLTTRTITFKGNKIVLNLDASAMGQLKLEVLNQNGCPIEGFTLEEADLIYGNHVNKTVKWQGNSDISILEGKKIKLRFVMRGTKLYSFQFKLTNR